MEREKSYESRRPLTNIEKELKIQKRVQAILDDDIPKIDEDPIVLLRVNEKLAFETL